MENKTLLHNTLLNRQLGSNTTNIETVRNPVTIDDYPDIPTSEKNTDGHIGLLEVPMFGGWIRQQRKKLAFTLSDLATALNMSPDQTSQLEAGYIQKENFDGVCTAIAKLFKVNKMQLKQIVSDEIELYQEWRQTNV